MKAQFRNTTTGEIQLFDVETKQKRLIRNEAGEWKRIPKPKPKSRADRANDVVGELETLKSGIEEVMEKLDDLIEGKEGAEIVVEDDVKDWGVSTDELESLKGELEEWHDNMEGTNLEGTGKYEELGEAIDALDSAINAVDEIEIPNVPVAGKVKKVVEGQEVEEVIPVTVDDWENYKGELEEVVSKIEDAVSAIEDVSFPGMY